MVADHEKKETEKHDLAQFVFSFWSRTKRKKKKKKRHYERLSPEPP
jgi:methyl coenzyme M reductase subunit C-like uncharacterized protein (methanogenesis marker protein 7)